MDAVPKQVIESRSSPVEQPPCVSLRFRGKEGLRPYVQSVHLIARGQKLDRFVVRRDVYGTTQYHLTITEEGTTVAVEVVARLADSTARGQATVSRRIH